MKLRRLHNPAGWTSLPNATLEDRSISWRARGLLAYLLSRPDGWETDSVRLSALAGEAGDSRSKQAEGRDAVRTALGELERAHYLHRVRRQGSLGRWSTEYYVFDTPTVDGVPASLAGQIPLVDSPVDNSGENLSPETAFQSSVNPASLTSNNHPLDPASQGDLTSANAPAVESRTPAPPALPSPELASLPREADDLTAELLVTDAIAKASRLEPGVQMFALRAHLVGVLGFQPTFPHCAEFVADAHVGSPPSLRGRLSTGDVLEWVAALAALPELSSGSASVEAVGSAAVYPAGLAAVDRRSAPEHGVSRSPISQSTSTPERNQS